MKEILRILGMTCKNCKTTIEDGLKELKGLTEVHVDTETETVTVTFVEAKSNIFRIVDKIEEMGYSIRSSTTKSTPVWKRVIKGIKGIFKDLEAGSVYKSKAKKGPSCCLNPDEIPGRNRLSDEKKK